MPTFSQPVYAPSFIGASQAAPANPFGVTFFVSGTAANAAEDSGGAGVTPRQQGRTPKNPYATIAAAITDAVAGRGDTIIIQRGTYTENLTVNKAGLTLVGAMGAMYPDHVTISGRTLVTAGRVSFKNLEFFSNSATANVGSVTVGATDSPATLISEVDSSYFENCSFASDGTTEPPYGLRIFGGNNHTILGCRFIDNTRALALFSGDQSFVSGVIIEHCHFLENTTYDLGTGRPAGETLGVDGGVRNLVCRYNVFGRGEVTPTAMVNIAGTSSGIMTHNYFANATNASSAITIPAGILYVANATEAGITTARPS